MNKLLYVGLLVAGAVSSSVAVRGLTGREAQMTPILMLAGASAIAGAVITQGRA